MAVISVRLNAEEERMIDILSDHFEKEKSSLIKHSLKEMYEDLIDRNIIESFENEEKKGKIKFVASNDIMNLLEK